MPQEQDDRVLGIRAISGAAGALVGIVVTIFTAGIYYANLKALLVEYIKKINSHENAIHDLNSDVASIKNTIVTLGHYIIFRQYLRQIRSPQKTKLSLD
jgi:hypothetical protein